MLLAVGYACLVLLEWMWKGFTGTMVFHLRVPESFNFNNIVLLFYLSLILENGGQEGKGREILDRVCAKAHGERVSVSSENFELFS